VLRKLVSSTHPWMSTFYTFLLANQPKSALNDHGNKDIGDKLYCTNPPMQEMFAKVQTLSV
jgi:hypothetical protein